MWLTGDSGMDNQTQAHDSVREAAKLEVKVCQPPAESCHRNIDG